MKHKDPNNPETVSLLRFLPLLGALVLGRLITRVLTRFPKKQTHAGKSRPGISVVIPECCTPHLLGACLAATYRAADKISEPVEVIVVVNGASLDKYAGCKDQFRNVKWLHNTKPLGFGGAVSMGVRSATFDWVYLLNSDMTLDADALCEVAKWRAAHVFAIATQIFFADSTRRREETGWTDFRISPGGVEAVDVCPEDSETVRGHLYAGGGSSLYRRELLLRVMNGSDPYHPCYWEDVEWGVRAWRLGYEVLFCPRSKATHIHRATVAQLYEMDEINRIFRRNALVCDLRNDLTHTEPRLLIQQVGTQVRQSQVGLCSVRFAMSVLCALCRDARAPQRPASLQYLRKKFYLRPIAEPTVRPRLLIVAPYAVCPPLHGGAKRITGLIQHLALEHEIIFLGDEDALYANDAVRDFKGPVAVHLVGGRPAERGEDSQNRISRIQVHSHSLLKCELDRIVACYRPNIVQLEHVELAGLIKAKRNGAPWFITLHDVLFDGSGDVVADRFERRLVNRFTGVITCTREDAELVNHPSTRVVPNGVEERSRVCGPSLGKHSILFVGPFRYPPNFMGIQEFLEKVYPKLVHAVPDVHLDILGGPGAPELASQMNCFDQTGVRVHGPITDVYAWLENCALTINPVYGVGGSSVKLIESIASGRLCISTQQGARGFADLNLPALIQVTTVDNFLELLQLFLRDEAARLQLEKPAAWIHCQLSWAKSARIQGDFYNHQLSQQTFYKGTHGHIAGDLQ